MGLGQAPAAKLEEAGWMTCMPFTHPFTREEGLFSLPQFHTTSQGGSQELSSYTMTDTRYRKLG